QQSLAGHRAVTVWLESPAEVAHQLERRLFEANCRVIALSASEIGSALAEVCRTLNDAGVIALIHGSGDVAAREHVRIQVGAANFLHVEESLPAERIHRLLEEEGILSISAD